MVEVYQLGTTVRLTALFRDWANAVATPTIVQVKIYDSKWQVLGTYSVGVESKLPSGAYYYDYQLPDITYRTKCIYVEWYAEIDGQPSLKRYELVVNII